MSQRAIALNNMPESEPYDEQRMRDISIERSLIEKYVSPIDIIPQNAHRNCSSFTENETHNAVWIT